MIQKRSHSIINHLRDNSRNSLATIARKENLAVSTVFEHVHNLQESIIQRFITIPNYQKLGFPFRTLFFCQPTNAEALQTFLQAQEHTNNVYQLTDGKLAADMIFPSLEAEEKCKEAMKEHCNYQEHRILEPLAQEAWRPLLRNDKDL